MTFYVYVLRLEDDHLYVGSTSDLDRRLASHRSGEGRRTILKSPPVELLYSEEVPDLAAALNRGRQLKGSSRAKKLALIDGDFQTLKSLDRCRSVGR